jgi:anti-anti-sigma regulatory factor
MSTPGSAEKPRLEYTIVEKSPYAVISFRGLISQITKPIIEKCQEEVLQKNPKYVVLNFQDVSKIESNGVPALHRLQMAVRDKQGTIRVCSLTKDMRSLLLEAAAIRLSEISENLAMAIQRLQPPPK